MIRVLITVWMAAGGGWGLPQGVRSWSSKRLNDVGSFVDGGLWRSKGMPEPLAGCALV
jgi:hypothetical protein